MGSRDLFGWMGSRRSRSRFLRGWSKDGRGGRREDVRGHHDLGEAGRHLHSLLAHIVLQGSAGNEVRESASTRSQGSRCMSTYCPRPPTGGGVEVVELGDSLPCGGGRDEDILFVLVRIPLYLKL